jgi:hypothetical protein
VERQCARHETNKATSTQAGGFVHPRNGFVIVSRCLDHQPVLQIFRVKDGHTGPLSDSRKPGWPARHHKMISPVLDNARIEG